MKAVVLIEEGEITSYALDHVGEAADLLVRVADREDIHFERHGCFFGELRLGEGAEDRLGSHYDRLLAFDDLAGGTDRMFELLTAHPR